MEQIEQNQIKRTFEELYAIEANKKCFECESFNNKWASVNNGIFLCINCAQIHRNMGINISFVRSVELDFWTESQLNQMIKGGNQTLERFFKQYSIQTKKISGENTKEEIQYKYKTKASEYYRTYLKCLADGVQPPTAPTLEEGVQLFVDINSPDFNQIYNPLNADDNQDQQTKEKEEKQNIIAEKFLIFKGFMGKQIDEISEKMKQTHIKEDIVQIGDKIAVKTKDFGSKTASKTVEAYHDVKKYISDKTSQKPKLQFQEVLIDENGQPKQQNQSENDATQEEKKQIQKPLLSATQEITDSDNQYAQDQKLQQNDEFEQKQQNDNQEEEKKTTEVIKEKIATTYNDITDYTKKKFDDIQKKLTPDEETKLKFKAAKEKASQKTSELGHTVVTEAKQLGEKSSTLLKKGFASIGLGDVKNKLTSNKPQDQQITQNIQNQL